MSRGQSQTRTRSGRTALRRCNNKSTKNTMNKIDVIIVDTPESSNSKSRRSNNTNKRCFPTVICIEEDDDDIGSGRVDHDAMSSKTFHPSFGKSYAFEEFDSDECQLLDRKGKRCAEYPKRMFYTLSPECSTSKSDTSERCLSEIDILESEDLGVEGHSSDCEIMDGSSVNIRKEWEKAALKKKTGKRHSDSKEEVGTFGFHDEGGVSPCVTSGDVNMNSSSCDTYTAQNQDEVHSHADTSVNRARDSLSAFGVLNDFMEQHSFKLKRKDSVGASDHTVREDNHEECDSKNRNEPLSGKASPHRCQSQPEVSVDHKPMASSCGQDTPCQSPSSCDIQMQHGFHRKPDGGNSMNNDDNGIISLSTVELRDAPQYQDMQTCENLSPCNISCCSLDVPGLQTGLHTGKVTVVAQDSSCFQSHNRFASSEPGNHLGEQNNDMLCTHHSFGGEEAVSQGSMENFTRRDVNPAMILQTNVENMDIVSDIVNDIIGERERLKDSEEYRRAEEEEWASRQRQLQIQSEEAQRLRKRKKAENLRLVEMEKRQKERLEEMRESQKRDEEAINLKEKIRAEIQMELKKLEMKYRDMASLLRALGINVCGGLYPLPHEVNAAYKQALLRFHPDRASRTDIKQQVEAEEKFKLISRLKEKLLPVAY